ncbi:unnamed protein product [Cochlearia groenlandica]
MATPPPHEIWKEEDELTLLKGLVDYESQTMFEPSSDWVAIVDKYTKEQLSSKISSLKNNFLSLISRQSNLPLFFSKPIEAQAFRFSQLIWGQNCQTLTQIRTQQEKEDKGNDTDTDDDDIDALKDAFETLLSRDLTDYQKMLQLKKLMCLLPESRKELSFEWKALRAEEAKLCIKRLRFSAKLVDDV